MRNRRRIAELYSELGGTIAVILTSKLRLPPDVAQDAVHDIFMTLLTNQQATERVLKLDNNEAIRYLLKAAQHRAFHEIRRRQRVERSLEEVIAKLVSGDQPDLELARTEKLGAIRAEFERLDQPYREVLELLLVKRKSASEIARLLNRPTNTIYQQMHRGLLKLRSAIRHLG